MLFGTQIRQLRRNRHWTIEQLAEKCDMSVNSISKIERNINTNVEVATLMKLAKVFETTPNKLLNVDTENDSGHDYQQLIKQLDLMDKTKRTQVLNSVETLINMINKN